MFVMLFAARFPFGGRDAVCGYQYNSACRSITILGVPASSRPSWADSIRGGATIASLLLGALTSGATSMQVMTNVPDSIVDVLQGMLLVAAICADRIAMYKIVKRGDRA